MQRLGEQGRRVHMMSVKVEILRPILGVNKLKCRRELWPSGCAHSQVHSNWPSRVQRVHRLSSMLDTSVMGVVASSTSGRGRPGQWQCSVTSTMTDFFQPKRKFPQAAPATTARHSHVLYVMNTSMSRYDTLTCTAWRHVCHAWVRLHIEGLQKIKHIINGLNTLWIDLMN